MLPFGLSMGPYIFTKVGRVLVKKWRAEGKSIILYLDDGIGGDTHLEKAIDVSHKVRSDLVSCGFLLSEEKCVWEVRQKQIWLGYVFDTSCGKLFAKPERLVKLQDGIRHVIFKLKVKYGSFIKVREFARIVGQIISLRHSVGNMTRLRTRNLYCCVESRASWDSDVVLTGTALEELEFWNDNIRILDGKPWQDARKCTRVIYSDASNTGYGGYVVNEGSNICHGQWTPKEMLESSTWRELEAVRRMLVSLEEVLVGHKVKWFTDNQNVARIAEVGSTRGNLQDLALGINQVCIKRDIELDLEWIPREENQEADRISRIVDWNDWGIKQDVMQWLESKWCKFTFDRFATDYNTKCSSFNSRFFVPGSAGVDAFAQDWTGDFNLLVPPPHLILQTWHYLKLQQEQGVLILPVWRSAAYWPFICPDGVHLNVAIQDWTDLPSDSLVEGRTSNSYFYGDRFCCRMLALMVSYKTAGERKMAGFCTSHLGYCDICLIRGKNR